MTKYIVLDEIVEESGFNVRKTYEDIPDFAENEILPKGGVEIPVILEKITVELREKYGYPAHKKYVVRAGHRRTRGLRYLQDYTRTHLMKGKKPIREMTLDSVSKLPRTPSSEFQFMVKAEIREFDSHMDKLAIMATENMNRQNLSAYETAVMFWRFREEANKVNKKAGRKVYTDTYIANQLKKNKSRISHYRDFWKLEDYRNPKHPDFMVEYAPLINEVFELLKHNEELFKYEPVQNICTKYKSNPIGSGEHVLEILNKHLLAYKEKIEGGDRKVTKVGVFSAITWEKTEQLLLQDKRTATVSAPLVQAVPKLFKQLTEQLIDEDTFFEGIKEAEQEIIEIYKNSHDFINEVDKEVERRLREKT